MKKVLLATTILGMTAGFAAAEVAFTGEATAGFAQNGAKNGGVAAGGNVDTDVNPGNTARQTDSTITPYTSFKLSVAASGESDSGLSFGASASISSGVTYTMANDKGFNGEGATLGNPTVFVSGDFGKLAFKQNGFKEYQDDNSETYDIEYTHSVAGVSIGVRSNLDKNEAATSGKSSISLGYTVAGITLAAAYDEVKLAGNKDSWGVSAAYALNDALKFTLATNSKEEPSLKVAYSANGISADIKATQKPRVGRVAAYTETEVNAGYSANGISVAAGTKVGSGLRFDNQWKVTAGYDLGGGLTAEAGINYTDDMFLGARMKF